MQATNPLLAWVGFAPQGDLDDLTCYTSQRGRVVWFTKTPPGKAPSENQIFNRNRFRHIGLAWQTLQPETRHAWHQLARHAHIYLHGYTLFLWYCMHQDPRPILTLQRNTGVIVLPNT